MPNRSCEYESSAAHYEGGHLSAISMLPFTQPRLMNEAFWALRATREEYRALSFQCLVYTYALVIG